MPARWHVMGCGSRTPRSNSIGLAPRRASRLAARAPWICSKLYTVASTMQVLSAAPNHVLERSKPDAGKHSTESLYLSMYHELPEGNITIEDFESLALDRLRVLKGIEEYQLRNKGEEAVKNRAIELFKTHIDAASNEEMARRDCTSHYILRLAYCRTPELRKWLIAQETELFKHRFMQLLKIPKDKMDFLARHGLHYTHLSASEVKGMESKLRAVLTSQGVLAADQNDIMTDSFFKVPFTAVPDLVAGRKCYLQGGWAFVSNRDLLSLVLQEFRLGLSKGLADINRRWRDMFPDTDTRLRPLVSGLSTRYIGSSEAALASIGARHGAINLASLPAMAQHHFPLCMQHLMTQLHANHHLRHNGRQQLGLFLKAVGLPMEDAIVFWRNEFAALVPADKFDKEYAYNVRHNYGKEGARKDYTAHNCCSLVRMTGAANEYHGCPYKRMEPTALRAALARAGCDASKAEEAVAKARAGHYQIACATAFEGIHHVDLDVGINHPAEYYSESRRVHEERAAAAPARPANQRQSTAPAARAAGGPEAAQQGSGTVPAGATLVA